MDMTGRERAARLLRTAETAPRHVSPAGGAGDA
jgi:hypothetical protein